MDAIRTFQNWAERNAADNWPGCECTIKCDNNFGSAVISFSGQDMLRGMRLIYESSLGGNERCLLLAKAAWRMSLIDATIACCEESGLDFACNDPDKFDKTDAVARMRGMRDGILSKTIQGDSCSQLDFWRNMAMDRFPDRDAAEADVFARMAGEIHVCWHCGISHTIDLSASLIGACTSVSFDRSVAVEGLTEEDFALELDKAFGTDYASTQFPRM